MSTRDVVFLVLGGLCALSGLLAVTTRQVVHSALWLLVCLGTLAGIYVVLGQEFVGLVQLLVYVGAVVVLVLFALMLTRSPIGRSTELHTPGWQRALGAVAGGLTTALLLAVTLPLVPSGMIEVAGDAVTTGRTQGVGTAVFGGYVWPFELLSVLLLVALVGAFAVSKLVDAVHLRPHEHSTRGGGQP